MQQPPIPKKDAALYLLERSLVQFHIDPRKTGVILPPYLKVQPQVVLDIGLNTAVPIKDLHVDETQMSCTLSFNRTPFFCVLPWPSVFAMVSLSDGRGVVWPEDVPAESPLARTIQAQAPTPSSAPASTGEGKGKKPRKSKKKDESEAGDAEAGAAKKSVRPKGDSKRPKKDAAIEAPPSPALSAVPAERPRVVALVRPEPARAPAPPPLVAVPTPPPPRAAAKKPKREIPPYLKLVK